MKKVFCLLVALLLVTLHGCQISENSDAQITTLPVLNSNPTDSEVQNIPPVLINKPTVDNTTAKSEPAEIEYVIYYEASSEGMVAIKDENSHASNIRIESAAEMDFYYLDQTDISTEVENKIINLVLPNTNTEVSYIRSFSNSFAYSANTNLKKYAYYNEYKAIESEHNLIVRYRQNDNELVFFSQAGTRETNGPLTEQEAKTLADAFLIEKYGSQFFAEYPHYAIAHSQDNRRFTLAVVYQKYICGYPTTDEVIVKYNMNGELVALNAMKKGIFDDVESSITADKIANAETALLSAISSEWSINYKELALDVDGNCYLMVYASRDNPNFPFQDLVELYINID